LKIDPVRFQEAVALFNQGEFFECHEVLEDLWRPLPPSTEKTFLQGLLQVGVGFHHWRNGNLTGAKNLLEAGCEKLATVLQDNAFPAPFPIAPLLTVSQERLQQVRAEYPASNEFPQIQCGASL
jgi:hypothetical protein